MDTDLEEWRFQELGVKPAYLLPSWGPLATLITGLEPRPRQAGQAMPEAERPACASELERKPSWFSQMLAAAGRQLFTLSRRLPEHGTGL